MNLSQSVMDYIIRGQLLPGPVLKTVTHNRDIKSLNDNKITQTDTQILSDSEQADPWSCEIVNEGNVSYCSFFILLCLSSCSGPESP